MEWYLERTFRNSPSLMEHLQNWQAVLALSRLQQIIIPTTNFFYTGRPVVRQFFAVQDQTLATKQRVLQLAGSLAAESNSEQLQALVQAAQEAEQPLREVEVDRIAELGVTGRLDRTWFILGDEACMQAEQIELGVTVQTLVQQFEVEGKYTLFLAQKHPKRLLGIFACEYQIAPQVPSVIAELQKNGCEVVLLTEAKTRIARGVGRQVGIALIHSELQEQEKQRIIASLLKQQPDSVVLIPAEMQALPGIPTLHIGLKDHQTLGWEESVEDVIQRLQQARQCISRARKRLFWCKLPL